MMKLSWRKCAPFNVKNSHLELHWVKAKSPLSLRYWNTKTHIYICTHTHTAKSLKSTFQDCFDFANPTLAYSPNNTVKQNFIQKWHVDCAWSYSLHVNTHKKNTLIPLCCIFPFRDIKPDNILLDEHGKSLFLIIFLVNSYGSDWLEFKIQKLYNKILLGFVDFYFYFLFFAYVNKISHDSRGDLTWLSVPNSRLNCFWLRILLNLQPLGSLLHTSKTLQCSEAGFIVVT